MSLRNIVLTLSLLVIAFCISLYFQPYEPVQSFHLDQYKNLQYNEERSRSLTDLNQKLSPYKLEELIREVYSRNKLAGEKTRVMEIGAGNGRVLMELKKKFPQVEFYGVNKEKTRTFYRRDSFSLTALKFEIFTKEELAGMELPYVVFQDLDFGNRIPYDEEKFDIIYSQSTIDYIKYKFELFNEIMRVLKKGGISFHTDVTGILLYSRGVVQETRDALAEMRRHGIDISTLDNKQTIRFKKTMNRVTFPVLPHQSIPTNPSQMTNEARRPEMGYNLIF